MLGRFMLLVAATIIGLIAQPGVAAMYKWVDERGVVHYGDRVPTQANNSTVTFSRATGAGKAAAQPVALSADEAEKQKADARRKLMQDRQDAALIATYTNESEIDATRERELKRHQDMLQTATEGLAKSSHPDDKRKLDQLLMQGQQAADAINAKFHAQKMRYRELKGNPALAQAPASAAPAPSP